MKALILAAGYGTRLQPLTNDKPKALVELHGKTLLEHAINNLKKHGITDIIVNVHHFAEQIIDFLRSKNNFDINISISDESKLLLDTGGGIKKARSFFNNEPFIVYNVDIISNIDLGKLIANHKNSDAIATLAVKERHTSRQILFDEELNLCEWQNIITGERKPCRTAIGKLKAYGFSGFQIIEPAIFDLMTEEVFSIIPFYLQIAKNNNIKAHIHNQSEWYDVGRYEYLMDMNAKEIDFL